MAASYCNLNRARAARAKQLRSGQASLLENWEKFCTKCARLLPNASFHKASRRSTQLQSWCRDCSNAYRKRRHNTNHEYKAKRREAQRRLYRKDPAAWNLRVRKNEVVRNYGLTWEEYTDLIGAQGSRCALCLSDTAGGKGAWHIDHDHQTGNIRGLLCHHCNTRLGTYQKLVDAVGLDRIQSYLRCEINDVIAKHRGKAKNVRRRQDIRSSRLSVRQRPEAA